MFCVFAAARSNQPKCEYNTIRCDTIQHNTIRQSGGESNIDKLLKTISAFMPEVTDELRIAVVNNLAFLIDSDWIELDLIHWRFLTLFCFYLFYSSWLLLLFCDNTHTLTRTITGGCDQICRRETQSEAPAAGQVPLNIAATGGRSGIQAPRRQHHHTAPLHHPRGQGNR